MLQSEIIGNGRREIKNYRLFESKSMKTPIKISQIVSYYRECILLILFLYINDKVLIIYIIVERKKSDIWNNIKIESTRWISGIQ